MKKYPLAAAAALCLALSVFLKFALIGYSVLALAFLALAAVLGFYQLCLVKKLWKSAVFVSAALLLGVVLFCVFEVPVIAESSGSDDPEAPYLIVLGAGVNGSTPSLSMVNRLTAALAYLETYPDSAAILSGGQGPDEDLTEARAMFDWLTQNGIAAERLILEEHATSTEENLAFSLRLIAERGGRTDSGVAVCSSEYHLCRAKLLADRLGCSIKTVPARTTLPVLRINYFIREAFAMAYYRLF